MNLRGRCGVGGVTVFSVECSPDNDPAMQTLTRLVWQAGTERSLFDVFLSSLARGRGGGGRLQRKYRDIMSKTSKNRREGRGPALPVFHRLQPKLHLDIYDMT